MIYIYSLVSFRVLYFSFNVNHVNGLRNSNLAVYAKSIRNALGPLCYASNRRWGMDPPMICNSSKGNEDDISRLIGGYSEVYWNSLS